MFTCEGRNYQSVTIPVALSTLARCLNRYYYARGGGMSDANHGFTGNFGALVDEIVSRRKRRPVAEKSFEGRKRKYRGCHRKGVVRLMTVAEISEFRAHVQRCIDPATAPPVSVPVKRRSIA